MNWMDLAALLKEFIAACRAKGRTDEQIKAEIKNPGAVTQFLFENKIRKKFNFTWKTWKESHEVVMGPVYADIQRATPEEIDDIFEAAKEIDWTF
jgi:hypothetical protein